MSRLSSVSVSSCQWNGRLSGRLFSVVAKKLPSREEIKFSSHEFIQRNVSMKTHFLGKLVLASLFIASTSAVAVSESTPVFPYQLVRIDSSSAEDGTFVTPSTTTTPDSETTGGHEHSVEPPDSPVEPTPAPFNPSNHNNENDTKDTDSSEGAMPSDSVSTTENNSEQPAPTPVPVPVPAPVPAPAPVPDQNSETIPTDKPDESNNANRSAPENSDLVNEGNSETSSCEKDNPCPINKDLAFTLNALGKLIADNESLGVAFFKWSGEKATKKRVVFSEKVIQSLSQHSADQVILLLTDRLEKAYNRPVRNNREYKVRNAEIFNELLLIHIYVNPMAALQLPDFGIKRTLSDEVINQLAPLSDINKKLLSDNAEEKAEAVELQMTKLLSEGSALRLKLRNLVSALSEYARSVPDLEENGRIYSLNLMLIAVTNDLYLYGQKDLKSVGRNLLNVARVYDYMVCISENNAEECEEFIVPGGQPAGLVINKIRNNYTIDVPARSINEAIYRLKPAIYLIHKIAEMPSTQVGENDEINWYVN